MRRKLKTKNIIGFIIAIFIIFDFSFNDSILLTKFSNAFMDVSVSVGQKIGEWYADTVMNNK